jgi:hypothetical protein
MEERANEPRLDKLVDAITELRQDFTKKLSENTEVLLKIRDSLRATSWVTKLGFLFTILGLIATVVFGILPLTARVSNVGSRIEGVERSILARQFKITFPAEGATVERISSIRGETPFPEMNHYVIVIPVKTMDNWVQPGPVSVSASGLWSGSATFGTAAIGAGEQFTVRVLATKSRVSEGTLEKEKVPGDAIFSESITVTRSK